MRPSFLSGEETEAPIAIPSAAAWITKPVVVARLRDCFGVGVRDPKKPSDSSSFADSEDPPRLLRLICLGGAG
jgi:hypothetical protein